MLTKVDGLPAIFWLYLNRGQWFSSWNKITLTIINLIILGIAFAIVCPLPSPIENQN